METEVKITIGWPSDGSPMDRSKEGIRDHFHSARKVKRVYIVAANVRAAEYLAKVLDLQKSDWVYVSTIESFRGLRDITLYIYGNYRELNNLEYIIAEANIARATVLYINDRKQ